MSCCYPFNDEEIGTPYASIDTNGISRELVQLSLARSFAICKDGGGGGTRESCCVHVLDNEIEKISSFIDNLDTVDANVADKIYRRALANRYLLVQIKSLLLSGDQSKCLLNICYRLVCNNDEYWGYTSACEWPVEGL